MTNNKEDKENLESIDYFLKGLEKGKERIKENVSFNFGTSNEIKNKISLETMEVFITQPSISNEDMNDLKQEDSINLLLQRLNEYQKGKLKIVSSFQNEPREEGDVNFKQTEKADNFMVFLSYSTLDSKQFQIPKIAYFLKEFPRIEKVIYWEADSSENIVKFMEETLRVANVFLSFCTKNSSISKAVKGEWEAAYQRNRKGFIKIINVYEKEEDIPVLLLAMPKIKFEPDNFEKFIEKLYTEIMK